MILIKGVNMDTRKFIEENLRPSAKDVIESFQEALKIVGIKDLVYSEVKDFPEMPGNGVYPRSEQVSLHEGFDSLPDDYKFDLINLVDDNYVPYVVIKQGDFVNYLVVSSDVNYDVGINDKRKSMRKRYTLPTKNGIDLIGYACVRNLAHPEYGLDHGKIGFANLGDVISRTV